MNAFKIFGLEPDFIIDTEDLRKKYIALQLNHHPDLKGDELEVSAQVNESYNILRDDFKRFSFVLKLLLIGEPKLDNFWLMEMMELNDSIMESKENETLKKAVLEEIVGHEVAIKSKMQNLAESYSANKSNERLIEMSLELQKSKYIQRLRKIFEGEEEM